MAGALRVHPAELTGQPWTPHDPVGAQAQAGLTAIETALERYQLGVDPEVPVRPWPQIADDLERLVTTMTWTGDYAAQSELAPVLLGELHGAYVRMPHQRPEAPVAPAGILGCHAEDNLLDCRRGRWTSGWTACGVVPSPRDHLAVPRQDRGGGDRKTSAQRRRGTKRNKAASHTRSAAV
jgi:hypothetical protein